MTLTMNELFSGIGAQRKALLNIGIDVDVVGISEIDKYAVQSYEAIFGKTRNYGDISKVSKLDYADMWTYSFPCLTGDTLVLTSDGYKKIIDVKEGDLVYGHDGKLHTVSAFLDQGVKPTYEIKAMGLDSIRCTENHKFYVRKKYYTWKHKGMVDKNGWRKQSKIRTFSEPEWVECKNLDRNCYLGMPVNNLSQMPSWDGVEYTKWKNKHKELPLENNNFWYIVGRCVGDGWVKECTQKWEKDGEKKSCTYLGKVILCCGKHETNEIEEILSSVFHYTKEEDRTTFKYHISNKEFATFMNLFGRGALNKKIPDFVLSLPINLLSSFLKGYMESDGCFTNNRYKGTSISRELIYGLTQCIAKVYKRPFSLYCSKRKPTHIIEGRKVNQKDTYNFSFKESNSLSDKAFYEDGYIWYPVNSVLSTGVEEPVYDIVVEDCHSFIANNCITHNCTDLSVAGKTKGFTDEEGNQTRSGLLYEVQRLLEVAKENNTLPKYLLLENVKNLVGKKFKADFDNWLEYLDNLGYNNYWQVLNAKDYGVPQNRERVFVVSIRKDIEKEFVFPEKETLTLRLKDVIEEKVDEKYYINSERVQSMLKSTFAWEKTRIHGKNDVCRTLLARDWKDPKCVAEPIIVASRGRNPENPSDRTAGSPTEQRLEPNSQGITNTLTSVQKDNYVLEPKRIGGLFDTETEKHQAGAIWDKECVGSTVDTCQGGYRQPLIVEESTDTTICINSKGGRGGVEALQPSVQDRVHSPKGVSTANTVAFRPNVIEKDSKDISVDYVGGIGEPKRPNEKGEYKDLSRNYRQGDRVYNSEGLAVTLQSQPVDSTSGQSSLYLIDEPQVQFRIRKLTPKETWRLMSFSDEDFDKAKQSGMSNTQLYKQAGNSIVVKVLEGIFKNLVGDND